MSDVQSNEFKVGDKVRIKEGGTSMYGDMAAGDEGIVFDVRLREGRILVTDKEDLNRRVRPEDLELVEDSFKVGDKVRIIEGASSKYGHLRGGRECFIYSTEDEDGFIRVAAKDRPSVSRLVRPRDLERIVPNGPEEEPVDVKAIQDLADRLGLCENFDRVVADKWGWPSRKMEVPTMAEMRQLAHDRGYGSSFDEAFPKPPEPFIGYPEVGKWVKATMKDGSVKEFEVTENNDRGHDYLLTNFTYGPVGRTAIFIIPEGKIPTGDHPDCHVVEWEYIEKPWKVGDVVPAGTSLPKNWTGQYRGAARGVVEFSTYSPNQKPAHDRTIVWVQD